MASSFRTPLARARGLGSAKAGVSHWKLQRITSVSELILEIWFVVQLVRMVGSSYDEWVNWFTSPINASVMAVWMVSLFYHTKLGVQVVIEDYVHGRAMKIAALLALNLVAVGLAGASLVSIITISLRG
ncbi:MAG TPA: succinate dehydrogenase, hydrophobic membrane anchor protein [Geminicoccus sp.]|jgi:succinate dehydrogenase / fumarate reductase membrane anchor subunit|uniref:succinate dehydrogenase, hydrophobic membrane anchor protein n=1 Tax=Geminicoccus sp. TaxID=2024832 RepID=UPI002E30F850|nr:succinate dehydrogenase, hydrophobic membrane anchor protein [Geminicoccus sp.]HEX2526029.1 succinate dehydrogenase, hydrophobic membrane anchor protein [Geminicoccus sp.]